MRGLKVARGIMVIAGLAPIAVSPAQAATSWCVGSRPGCFGTIQGAVDAASDGDTIHVGRGRFAGGVVIEVSVHLVGAGAGQTVIAGGGPVLTIGSQEATVEPTVSLRGVTITGGVNESAPDSVV